MSNAAPQDAAPQAAPANAQPPAPQTQDQQPQNGAPPAANGAPPENQAAPPPDPLAGAKEAAKKARAGADKNRKLIQEKDQTAAQAAQTRRENEQLRQQLQMTQGQFQQLQQLIMTDKAAALRMLGMTEQQLAQKFIESADPNQALNQLKNELAEERKKREQFEQRQQQDAQIARAKQAEQTLLKHITDNSEKYPHLAEAPDQVIINQAYKSLWELENIHKQPTAHLSADDIAHILESLWASGSKPKKSKAMPPSTDKPTAETQGNDTNTNGAPANRPAIKTLTNRNATSSFSYPKDFDSLPDHQQRRLMADHLRALGYEKKGE